MYFFLKQTVCFYLYILIQLSTFDTVFFKEVSIFAKYLPIDLLIFEY